MSEKCCDLTAQLDPDVIEASPLANLIARTASYCLQHQAFFVLRMSYSANRGIVKE